MVTTTGVPANLSPSGRSTRRVLPKYPALTCVAAFPKALDLPSGRGTTAKPVEKLVRCQSSLK